MADGVVYIKIAKTDKNGINQTNTLQSLNQVTIPYSTGNITYKVLNIAEYPTFFLYYVDPAGVEWADRAEIKYDFTGSLTTSSFSLSTLNPFERVSITTPEKDSLNFYNSTTQQYIVNTYPQKDIHFILTGSYSNTGGTQTNIRILANPNPSNLNPTYGDLEIVANKEAIGTGIGQNIIITGSYTLTTPGTEFLVVNVINGFGFATTSFTGSQLFITSSDATGQQVGLVPEPYFGSNNFNRALDCQPLLNNVDTNRRHNLYQDVDYSAGITEPTNFDLLISGSALRAEVQLSNYTTRRHVIPRYEGSKSTSQKLNKWSKGDTGTFGKTPTIESLKTVIAYCDFLGSWSPDRELASTAHVLYLIDADGNIGVPNTSENSLPNMQGSFQTGERFRISSRTVGSGEPDPLRTIIRGGSRIENILYTQKRGAPSQTFVSSFILEDIDPTAEGDTTNDLQATFILSTTSGLRSVGDEVQLTIVNQTYGDSAIYDNTGDGFYKITSDHIFDNIDVNFNVVPDILYVKLQPQMAGAIAFTDGISFFGGRYVEFDWQTRIYIRRDGNDFLQSTQGGTLKVTDFESGTPINLGGVDIYGHYLSYSNDNYSHLQTFPTSELEEGDLIYATFKITDSYYKYADGSVAIYNPSWGSNAPGEFWFDQNNSVRGDYVISQYPTPTPPIIVGNNEIWGYYDKTNYPYVITSSDAVSSSLGITYNTLNVKQQDISGSGFEPISLPWSLQYGDEFRFEGEERNTYMIKKVYGPTEGSGSRITPTGSIEVQFNKNLPVSASIANFNLDHFSIRRYVDDASQIIFEGFKPLQSQGPFILTPEFSTKELNVNIDDVITNLKERGLITGEEGT